MGNYTQKGRPMRVDGPLAEDTLILEGLEAQETIQGDCMDVLPRLAAEGRQLVGRRYVVALI